MNKILSYSSLSAHIIWGIFYTYFRQMKLLTKVLMFVCLSFLGISANAQMPQTIAGKVIVLPLNIQVPANAKKLGTIKLGNNSTQLHCAYDDIIAQAKDKAKVIGGNIVKITELITPVFVGKCYKIKADIYYTPTLPEYNINSDAGDSTITQLSDTDHFALLYVYRLTDTITFQPGYDLYMNDSVVCHVRNRSKVPLKIYKEGATKFSAETEYRVSTTIDLKFGKIYFLRCGTIMGSIRQVPRLEQVPYEKGIVEYERLMHARKDISPTYLNKIH